MGGGRDGGTGGGTEERRERVRMGDRKGGKGRTGWVREGEREGG